MSEAPGLISFDEWSKLSAENRHRYNLLVMEIQSLQTENARLRAQLERIASIAYEIDWGVTNQARIGKIIDIAEDRAQHVKSVLKIIRDGFKEEGGEG